MRTVYLSAGNSDDKLTQKQWSDFVIEISAEVAGIGHVHGAWFSAPAVPYQNACWCIEFATDGQAAEAKREAALLRRKYGQDSIAWAEAPVTEFI